jgi:lambda family phage tail tape measure protein
MGPHRREALRRFFGGSMTNVGYGSDAAGADMAQGYQEQQRIAQEAAKAAEETAKQLTAARDLLATKEAQLQVAAAMTPLEKLSAEYDQARAERMRDYADKLAAAKSDQERELLVKSQITDWARQELEHKQKLTDLTAQQLTQERERAELLADSMARMQELTSRSSAGAGFQQGLQGYVDSVGNLRDAVGQLTTDSIGGLEDSLTELATTGTTNFKAFAASVLQDTSRMIIRQLVLKTIMQIIGGIGGGAGRSFEMPSQAFIPSGGYGFAKGGIFGGDMVTSPTMFKFASGGAFRTGVMGEAGPEAIMPLRRGRDGRLGVAAAGGTSNAITINVDASGTKASGDPGTGAALARDLARVVDDRLIHHRRPGGLLAA